MPFVGRRTGFSLEFGLLIEDTCARDSGLESTRNPRIGEMHQRFDRSIMEGFERLFQKLKDEGRIAPTLDIPTVANVFMVISDGMFWRRAVDPAFKPQAVMPAVLQLIAELLKPVSAPAAASNNNEKA